MGKATTFKDLIVWQEAHNLVLNIYKMTTLFPSHEKFGLVSQMRRAAVSVPSNVAEGFGKRGIKDKCNFYNIAQGSLEELKYYLILSRDLGYMAENDGLLAKADKVGKMLNRLWSAIKTT